MPARHVTATNKYLRDAAARADQVVRSARSSSAVEGIRRPFEGRDPRKTRFANAPQVSFPQR